MKNDVLAELLWQAALTELAVRFSVPLGIISHLNGLTGQASPLSLPRRISASISPQSRLGRV
jgi:hypothetical protein